MRTDVGITPRTVWRRKSDRQLVTVIGLDLEEAVVYFTLHHDLSTNFCDLSAFARGFEPYH